MFKRISAIIIVIIIVVGGVIIYYGNREEDKIPEYESNLVCKSTNTEMLDDEEVTSTSIIYIYTDHDNVTKIINQAISSNNINSQMLESIVELYKPIGGLDASLENKDDKIVFEVQYDFALMDLDKVKKDMGNILADDSIIVRTKSLPIKVDDYLESLSSKYKCEQQ